MQRKRKWKWEIEGYCAENSRENRDIIVLDYHPPDYAGPAWLVDSETAGIYLYYESLREAKAAVRKYCKNLKFKPYIWTKDFQVKHPREGEQYVSVEIEKQEKARYGIRIDSPLLRLGECDTVYTKTLSSAKKACEALVDGILGFLEATGWTIKE